jgi:hypothetical protein
MDMHRERMAWLRGMHEALQLALPTAAISANQLCCLCSVGAAITWVFVVATVLAVFVAYGEFIVGS